MQGGAIHTETGAAMPDAELRQRLVHGVLAVRKLTRREAELLELLAQGWSNSAISEHMGLSAKTVESHIRSVLVKLGLGEEPALHRRVLAARIGMLAGLSGRPTEPSNRS